MKKFLIVLVRTVDVLASPITYLSGYWLKHVRRGFHHLPMSRKILRHIGVLPIRHHYYEPMILKEDLLHPLKDDRSLPGLNMNVSGQLALLEKFDFNEDLLALPLEAQTADSFHYHNGNFESGDAEFLLNIIRHFKPANIIEVGSGQSTLMALHAIERNHAAENSYSCNVKCIEPYEQPWLEATGAEVIRQRVETINPDFFQVLGKNDILFIDSSHIIRPQGDVLFEYLEILASLKSGVLIHAHDIYTPKDYDDSAVLDDSNLWNEQYLLEAFLSFNNQFSVIGSLNFLWHHYRQQLIKVCPILEQEPDRQPGSFWFVRN